ncbi:MAG: sulfatase-like hydrolase/transferase [Pseudomonadota bacterium]
MTETDTQTPPDIVVIMTDQQRYDTIRALGAAHAETPNIDRLVERGVAFTQCHVPAPSCVPCRASVFTGQYPHTTGVLANGQDWSRTWVPQLTKRGYHAVSIGKMHTVPYDAPAGFHERIIVENKDRYLDGRWFLDDWDKAFGAQGLVKQQRELYRQLPDYKQRLGAFEWELPEHMHPDVYVGRMAQWHLRTKPIDKPLFMVIGFPGPHPPYDPTPEFAEKWLARDLPLPEPSQAELDALPEPFKEKRRHDVEVDHDAVAWDLAPSLESLHRMRAYYAANMEMIDREVGGILDALEAAGRGDAIVVFCSDHGDCLGDHGLSQKWAPYEEVTRVPLIVSGPGIAGGRTVDGMVQLHDLAATILELAGAEPEAPIEAVSFAPALRGEAFEGRSHVFCEQSGDVNFTGASFMTMVRSATHKLVHFMDHPHGQLFDLGSEEGETRNLWDDPASEETKRHLMAALADWHIRSAHHTRETRRRSVN